MNIFQKFLLSIANFLFPFKVIGAENIPEDNCVICCNHLSCIDVSYIVKYFNKNTFFVAKKEVLNNKLFGKLLKSYGGIPVDREKTDIRSLMNIIKLLKSGNNLVIFPEGTRNKSGTTELQEFKGGSMVLAAKAKKRILPLIIYKKAKLFRRNYFIIGKPFELADYYDKKLDDENVNLMENFVRDKMIELQSELHDIIKTKKKKERK